jgi:hypothetical protein
MIAADNIPGDLSVSSFGPRMVCTKCGTVGAEVRRGGEPRQPVGSRFPEVSVAYRGNRALKYALDLDCRCTIFVQVVGRVDGYHVKWLPTFDDEESIDQRSAGKFEKLANVAAAIELSAIGFDLCWPKWIDFPVCSFFGKREFVPEFLFPAGIVNVDERFVNAVREAYSFIADATD